MSQFNNNKSARIEIGEVAAKLLIDRLESKMIVPYETVVIKTKLKERESTNCSN
jgi:LacI family transcriptional regulator